MKKNKADIVEATLYLRHILLYMKIFALLIFVFAFSACKDEYTPKPKGYFRIDLPENEYLHFDEDFPYSFDYSKYAEIDIYNRDSLWINIEYPRYRATIHLSYKKVDNNNDNNNIIKYLEESRALVYKHTIKADAIGEKPWVNRDKKVYGILYDIEGNAASPVNFVLTDSTDHFFRGALYFFLKPNKDSLAPVVEYLRKDITRLIESFEWKGE